MSQAADGHAGAVPPGQRGPRLRAVQQREAGARAARQPDSLPGTSTGRRNPGMPLDLEAVRAVRVNRSAADARAATLTRRRSVKREWQAGWLLRAVTMMDLTTLAGDDTPGRVQRLCGKARRPVRDDILAALEIPPGEGALLARVHREGEVLEQQDNGMSIRLTVRLPEPLVGRLRREPLVRMTGHREGA